MQAVASAEATTILYEPAASVLERINTLNAVGERPLEAANPGAAPLEFLTVTAHQRQQRDLSFLQDADALNAEVTQVRAQSFQTIHAVVDRARASTVSWAPTSPARTSCC
jgi:hypothetical protein